MRDAFEMYVRGFMDQWRVQAESVLKPLVSDTTPLLNKFVSQY